MGFAFDWGRRCVAGLGLLALAGCGTARIPYTADEARGASIGIEGVRSWADAPDLATVRKIRASLSGRPAGAYLALSGGGGDGAYGAGFLAGWSESGQRPEFQVVSGASTGALIAPFAFLGRDYDGALQDLYTSGVAETLMSSPDPFRAIFGSSIFSDERLRALVSRYVTPQVIDEIAAAGRRGRMLLVVTTDLDQQRPVLWDLTALAMDGTPRAVELMRSALVASAAIPAVFPSVLFDVTSAEGRPYQEVHVDGTVTTSFFTIPRAALYGARPVMAVPPGSRLFVLINGKLEPDFAVVSNTAGSIGTRTFSTFIKTNSRADIVDTYRVAKEAGIGFRVTFINKNYPTAQGAGFDTPYMRKLYDYGLERGRRGDWRPAPPDLTPGSGQQAATAAGAD